MGAVLFTLSGVQSRPQSRPDFCPHCDSRLLQGWGWEDKLIEDVQFNRVTVHRYRCEACGRTFRHYPPGVDRAGSSLRVRQAAAILWGMGLSLHAVDTLMRMLGLYMSQSSIWRASEPVDRSLRRRLREGFHPFVTDSLDGTVQTVEVLGSMVILEFSTDISVGVGVIDASAPELRALAGALAVDISFIEVDAGLLRL